MASTRKKKRTPTTCPICQTVDCISLVCRARREWTPEAWDGALRMTEARLAAGYQLKTTSAVAAEPLNPESPSEESPEEIDWRVVRVPLELTEMDRLAMNGGVPT